MNFTITRKALLTLLDRVNGVIEKKNTIPILSNVLLDARGSGLTVTGTDLDVTLQAKYTGVLDADFSVGLSGSVCAPAARLREIARSLTEGQIQIRRDTESRLHLVSGRTRFALHCQDAENYPATTAATKEIGSVGGRVLAEALGQVEIATTKDVGRYNLDSVKIESTPEATHLIATDSHRLCYVTINGIAPLDVMLPQKAVRALIGLAKDASDVQILGDENRMAFQAGEVTLTTRLLSGQFPNWQLVLPKENYLTAVTDAAAVNAALQRVAVMSDERSQAVDLQISENRLTITAQSENGEANDEVEVKAEGVDWKGKVNSSYLVEFLTGIDGEVTWRLKDSDTQILLEHGQAQYVVMPMRG